ncbi:peptide chain release factor N(5)-glutamine methyltransferase [Robiginitalea sp. SC105]|uniref:peptide chain release factor N(5)-glutamine methyltransferase n=1 Tax=Robiginitalea sp. SC105 TaxID=2762332 RepID=UPI00163A4806|nr:peptide chain release factor N(5)-glutamine methyltransferase [Robiginitalea sp. SC105]MBC2840778.1 peptide chain release factor N(5)-glutamine methyltransferase [Robiginitalea sp. SC105]
MLLRDIRDLFRKELEPRYPVEEIDALFYRLLDHYLQIPRFILGLEPRKQLTQEEEQPLFHALSELVGGKPLQYITGTVSFMGMDLSVDPGVLIPRPETEELVRWILERHAGDLDGGRVLDIGTGSGCIALGLARNLPGTSVTGIDISAEALKTAGENVERLGLQVAFRRENILAPKGDWPLYDLMVSNPPYIPRSHAAGLHAHVRDQEPHEALFAPDADPLIFYRRIAAFGQRYLTAGGWLYVEIHEAFGQETETLFCKAGYEAVLLKKDIFGKDRFICGRKPIPKP